MWCSLTLFDGDIDFRDIMFLLIAFFDKGTSKKPD